MVDACTSGRVIDAPILHRPGARYHWPMTRKSAGLLMFWRAADGEMEVLLVHPGGPFWARKGAGAWKIPKREYDDAEEALAAANGCCGMSV